ncbi:flagellar hook-length control protein FliK [Marinobacter orientalis]|uniref:Flagellar hook-length control protein FliK n=1 Tax=Marinobacter orientalis TaxID=1928859 RepID=A0A7Y0REC7_9GAMM|nr:flagellar hook-length control protein FliK [Marinobacter orientalis]NMT64694.1 flagellar hook-length control protein FliK [Marinobacter orientalis]TGX48271.1 flagellar hook-length control protein FliK [Marinobacter orientalis]
MKLPNNNPVPPPESGTPAQHAGRASAAQPSVTPDVASARVQLDQLKLANREVTLARVAEVINRQSSGGAQLLLEIRGQALTVQAAIGETSLATGDWVKVMRAGNELQLMGKLAQAPEAGIARALAQRLPWQQSIDAGLTKLVAALTQGLKQDPLPGQLPSSRLAQPLPEPARKAIEQIVARLPSGNMLAPGAGTEGTAPQQVRQWLAESGLFAESRLARAPASELPDLKLALGRIITALLAQQGSTPEQFNRLTPTSTPELMQAPLQFPQPLATPQARNDGEPSSVGQMLRLLAGMLNRITVNQLHSQVLTARGGGDATAPTSTMLLDLPWLTPQNEPRLAQLRMDQYLEDRASEGESPTRATTEWRLSLAMDLDEAGPLHFDIALRQQAVSARVWAEKQTTLRRVNQELPVLRQCLADLGLEVTELECRRGTPQSSVTRLEHRLVDTRA